MKPEMYAAWYCRNVTWGRTWRSVVLTAVLCGLLGAVSLAALAGARRTESAYGRYLRAINASDVLVNVPSPDTTLDARVSALPGIRSSAAWLGLDANPVVHGRVNYDFQTNGFAGSVDGELFTQDTMTVLAGHLPPLDSNNEIALTPTVARLFGVGVGGRVTYQFEDDLALSPDEPSGDITYRVAAIVQLPPALVDQFDQVASAVIPPAATALARRLPGSVSFSWVAVRLLEGSAGVSAFQASVARLAVQVGHGYTFALRKLDTVHQQVQEAIRPETVAMALFGALAALALLVLVGQALARQVERAAAQTGTLRALGLTQKERALTCGAGGALGVVVGMLLAVALGWALSPLAPLGPVRQVDPTRGLQFDTTVLLGGGLVLALLLLGLLAWLSWRAVRSSGQGRIQETSFLGRAIPRLGFPVAARLGAEYALEAPPGDGRIVVRANVIGTIVAVGAVVTAVVFATSLNGLVTHPERYGWNWEVLIQNEGGYGDFLPPNVTAATLGNGDGGLDQEMAKIPGIEGWSTFGFTQLPIGGQEIPVLGLATHEGRVEPPTVDGQRLSRTQALTIGTSPRLLSDQIELGAVTLQQLGKSVGNSVRVGTGPNARTLKIVGTVTLPSIGVQLSDHVSLGRGAMLSESTLLEVLGLSGIRSAPEAVSALPSTVAIDLKPAASAQQVVERLRNWATTQGGQGDLYQVPRVLGAQIVNAGQMGSQPVVLAIALAVGVLLSLTTTILAAAWRRRRELAVLKALGLTRRQLRIIVTVQTLILLLIAVVVGIPVGIAAGHLLWDNFAASLGVVPVVVVPLAALVVGVIALLLVGTALATIPALVAARTPTAVVLRAE
jgi:FtsX-like permease family